MAVFAFTHSLGLKGFLSKAVLVFALAGVHCPEFVCSFGAFLSHQV